MSFKSFLCLPVAIAFVAGAAFVGMGGLSFVMGQASSAAGAVSGAASA